MYTKKQKFLHAAVFIMIVVFSMGTINYYVDSYAQLRTTYLDVAEKMAEIKGISVEEVERITTENAIRFYGIDSPVGL